jgi:L-alanine-DL-glutamate epimerase-like enolase superfamily enzyme
MQSFATENACVGWYIILHIRSIGLKMQIIRSEVYPIKLNLRQPIMMAHTSPIDSVMVVFIRMDLSSGQSAWGCTVAHEDLTGDQPEDVIRVCQDCAAMAPDLHPTNIEYSLDQLAPLVESAPSAMCAFDLAFHDLLGLASGMPLYRLLGGFRNSIQTSVTIPIGTIDEGVAIAQDRAKSGFRMLKIKGGLDPAPPRFTTRSRWCLFGPGGDRCGTCTGRQDRDARAANSCRGSGGVVQGEGTKPCSDPG